MSENAFWLVGPLSYQDTIKLAASDLIEHFQRDVQKCETKFWPGSRGVLKHLYDNLPEFASIINEGGTQLIQRETPKIKVVPVIHKMGQDIDSD